MWTSAKSTSIHTSLRRLLDPKHDPNAVKSCKTTTYMTECLPKLRFSAHQTNLIMGVSTFVKLNFLPRRSNFNSVIYGHYIAIVFQSKNNFFAIASLMFTLTKGKNVVLSELSVYLQLYLLSLIFLHNFQKDEISFEVAVPIDAQNANHFRNAIYAETSIKFEGHFYKYFAFLHASFKILL